MQKYLSISAIFLLAFTQLTKAQSLDSLKQLKNYSFPVYYSAGQQPRVEATAMRIEKAMTYFQQSLKFRPMITLVVLSLKDWNNYIAEPVIYGMPHYNEKNKRLIVAAEDNQFWRSFLPPPDQLPAELRKPFLDAYGDADGKLSAQAFFDLLAIHELGHAFHMQEGVRLQRSWMGELFSNIFLHTYIAEKEPNLLPALRLFPSMVVAMGTKGFKYTSLEDLQEHYNEIAQQYPKNYGWYQCRWHSAAEYIYTAGGNEVCRKLWNAFKAQKEKLSDQELADFLDAKVDRNIAAMIRNWDRDTKK